MWGNSVVSLRSENGKLIRFRVSIFKDLFYSFVGVCLCMRERERESGPRELKLYAALSYRLNSGPLKE